MKPNWDASHRQINNILRLVHIDGEHNIDDQISFPIKAENTKKKEQAMKFLSHGPKSEKQKRIPACSLSMAEGAMLLAAIAP